MVTESRILVVDDAAAVRRSLERVLRLADYDVVLADSGRAALEALAEGSYSLIVLDMAMPPPDGLEVLARLRETARDRGHRLVALPVIPTNDPSLLTPLSRHERRVSRCQRNRVNLFGNSSAA